MKAKKIFLVFYTIISLILIADIALVKKLDISFAGNIIDMVLYFTWVISSLLLVIISLKGHIKNVYLIVISVFLLLTCPFWLVLFFVTGLSGTNLAQSANGKYRVQVINQFAFPDLEIIENKRLFEQVIITDSCSYLRNSNLKIGYEGIQKIRFIKETPDSLFLEISTPWRKNYINYQIKK